MICAVVYGVDESYGAIATDLDMDGGAHTNHQPLMSDLLPDTEYVYRVQGFDAAGTLYVSEPMTFRTPMAATAPTNEINIADLATGAQITNVSSNFGNGNNDSAWGANKAIDSNSATAWSSNGDGNDAFIDVQLSWPAQPHAVAVWTRTMSNGTAQIFQFTLTTNPGTTSSQTLGPFTLPDATQAYRYDIQVSEQVHAMRLDVAESNGGNTGLIEFSVYTTQMVTATQTINAALYLPMLTRSE